MSDDGQPSNVLLRWYRRYIGEPETETDVYLGFGLFFAGVAAAAVGLVLVVVGASLHDFGTAPFYEITRPAGALLLLSLPVTMTAVVVLLPVTLRVTATAAVGVAVSAGAVFGFWLEYPGVLFGAEQNMTVVLGYAAGITVVTGATAAALIAHQLQRVRAPTPSEIREMEAPEPREEVTEEQVRADIDDAMAGVELSWGGIMKEEHRRLELTPDYADDYSGSIDTEATTTVSKQGVDSQVQRLKALKGGSHTRAASSGTVDDQAAALRELRAQKERDEVPSNAPLSSRGIFSWIIDRLGRS